MVYYNRTAYSSLFLLQHDRPQDKWVLFNIAALFFRAIGNPYHAVECVRRALHFSPSRARDVALIQLANILRRFGHVSDAAVVMRMALEQHPLEVDVKTILNAC